MTTINLGPCSIINCTHTNVKYRKLTELAYEKCYKKRILEVYPYLEVVKQLCHPHYCKIVEADRNQRRQEPTFASYIEILTKALYQIECIEGANLELDPVKFKYMIEATNPQLKGLRNKFVNQHKLEVGLYLMASGATWEAINMMSTLGYSKNLFHVYNIDNYYTIHENRRPDTISTSTANHFATCVAIPVIEHFSVQLTFNGVSVHNPENIEASKICCDDNSMVYVCGHDYHDACYNKKCKYCEEYYKRGIFKNVNSFLKRIEKGENKLTKEDLDDDKKDVEEVADEVSEKIEEALDTSSRLAAEIYKIEHW
ncbi:hypothetical protein C2G38_2176936 [Gigaspora rosea]|uniref:Uncharacterized protein n=1 Tax=Gigaspora rosea TaxID=44941 RepID=A0A397VN49_9GLOM|nr:hypothetical protein C2G38_2176936 [Gigaspora rosea]